MRTNFALVLLVLLTGMSLGEEWKERTTGAFTRMKEELQEVKRQVEEDRATVTQLLTQAEVDRGTVTQLQTQAEVDGATITRLESQAEEARADITQLQKLINKESTVAFHTTVADYPVSFSDQQIIKFDTVTLNEGKGYDSNTGKFTAPVDGLYLFYGYMRHDGDGSLNFWLYIKGVVQCKAFNGWDNGMIMNSYASATMSYVARLEKGDQAWFVNIAVRYAAYTEISGFLYSGFGCLKIAP